jgi:hypothetical protein
MLEANGQHESDWLPGCEFVCGKAKVKFHVWGIARAGSADAGELDFIEDGPQVAVTEVMVDLFGSSIPLTLSAVDSATRERIESHVREVVGDEKLAEMLWASVEEERGC